MGRLIMAAIVFIAVSSLKNYLGLSWPEFWLAAIGLPLGVWIFTLGFRMKPTGNAQKGSTPPEPDIITSAGSPPTSRTDGVTIRIGYVDVEGRETERLVTIGRIVESFNGLLSEVTYIKGWCHLSRGERTFRVDRIQWVDISEIERIAPHDATRRLRAALPQLIQRKRARDLFMPFQESKTIQLTRKFTVIIKISRQREELRVEIEELLVSATDQIVAIRGKGSRTNRKARFHLEHMCSMADAETGEIADDDVQEWLLARIKTTG